jgi:glycosyltransferase involved in cell wall biosynthesis
LAEGDRALSSAPFVSVIVPVWDDAAIVACLEGLARQTYPRDSFEVIVVDNGRQGASSESVAKFPFARTAHQPKPGSYAARNLGLSLARGSLLAFTDADCVPAPTWLERGAAEVCRLGVDLLAGRIDVATRVPGRPTPVELYEVVFGYRQEQSVRDNRAAYTANLFVRRPVFDKAGVFAELRSGGDLEFTRRAQFHGFRLAYSNLPVVATPARRTLGALWRRSARLRGGRAALRRLREQGAPWLQGGRARPSRLQNLRLIASYPAPITARAGAIGVALFVRAAFMAEGVRLALGGEPRR